MTTDLNKIRSFIDKNPIVAYPVIGLLGLGFWSLLMMFMSGTSKTSKMDAVVKDSVIGMSVGGVDQQAYIARLEKNYYDFEDRLKSIEDRLKDFKSTVQELQKLQKATLKDLKNLDEELVSKIDERISEAGMRMGNANAPEEPKPELAIADIKPIAPPEDESVYLPLGSLCKGRLLTGVYAVANTNNPLPVLIALEEAFYGPNKTRVPLKGSFVLGNAHGDLVSERALVQIVAISSVLPNGRIFERQENLGYITDEFGELGVHGQVIRNTGKQLALTFTGGIMAGASQAVADEQVTTDRSPLVGTEQQVTGDPAKHTLFSGLAKSAGHMSEYYERQAEGMVPAVHIKSGATVYFIMQKGVRIDGLPRHDRMRIADIN